MKTAASGEVVVSDCDNNAQSGKQNEGEKGKGRKKRSRKANCKTAERKDNSVRTGYCNIAPKPSDTQEYQIISVGTTEVPQTITLITSQEASIGSGLQSGQIYTGPKALPLSETQPDIIQSLKDTLHGKDENCERPSVTPRNENESAFQEQGSVESLVVEPDIDQMARGPASNPPSVGAEVVVGSPVQSPSVVPGIPCKLRTIREEAWGEDSNGSDKEIAQTLVSLATKLPPVKSLYKSAESSSGTDSQSPSKSAEYSKLNSALSRIEKLKKRFQGPTGTKLVDTAEVSGHESGNNKAQEVQESAKLEDRKKKNKKRKLDEPSPSKSKGKKSKTSKKDKLYQMDVEKFLSKIHGQS